MVFFCRSELSVEKTSVLQLELQSVKQLQELEPLNKCKCFFLYVTGFTGNHQLRTETDLWLFFYNVCMCMNFVKLSKASIQTGHKVELSLQSADNR